jgi:hypothetical protein
VRKKKNTVIPAYIRMTTLHEYFDVKSTRLTKNNVSFEEARRKVRELVSSTEGVQVIEKDQPTEVK